MIMKVFGRTIYRVGVVIVIAAIFAAMGLNAALAAADAPEAADKEEGVKLSVWEKVATLATIAITVSCSCIAAGVAVGKVGAAAMGAASEKPEIMGRALIFVGLAEGIAIYGLIIGIMLIGKI